MDEDYSFISHHFLVDEFAEEHKLVPIRLDLTEIPRLEYLDTLEIEEGRRDWFEQNGVKLGMNVSGGFVRILVRCPKHGEFGYMIRNTKDPCDGTLRCDRCIKERMLEIDQDRHERYVQFIQEKNKTEDAYNKQNQRNRSKGNGSRN